MGAWGWQPPAPPCPPASYSEGQCPRSECTVGLGQPLTTLDALGPPPKVVPSPRWPQGAWRELLVQGFTLEHPSTLPWQPWHQPCQQVPHRLGDVALVARQPLPSPAASPLLPCLELSMQMCTSPKHLEAHPAPTWPQGCPGHGAESVWGNRGHYQGCQWPGQDPLAPSCVGVSAACTDPAMRAAKDSAKREVVELSQQLQRER